MVSRTETNATDRLVHYLDLDDYGLREVPESQKDVAKQEAADFVKNEILRQLSSGDSPVSGEGRFKILNPEYARLRKGGIRTANLELEGDLKDSFFSRPDVGSFIKLGHEGDQVPKADGHNQISSKAKNWARQTGHPRRRYIPDDGQEFDRSIVSGIKRVIEPFKSPVRIQDTEELIIETEEIRPSTTTNIQFNTSSLFNDDVIEELLEEAFRRRNV